MSTIDVYDKMAQLRLNIRELASFRMLTMAQRIRAIVVLLCELIGEHGEHEKSQ